MNNKILSLFKFIIRVFPFVIIVAMSLLIADIEKEQDKLFKQIELRDSLINKMKITDSLYNAKNQEYTKTIKEYVTSKSFTVDDKEISIDEIVTKYNELIKENSRLSDSVQYYSFVLDQVYNKYGIKYIKYVTSDSTYYIKNTGNSTADSAMALFPFYKKYIKNYDPSKRSWTITVDKDSNN